MKLRNCTELGRRSGLLVFEPARERVAVALISLVAMALAACENEAAEGDAAEDSGASGQSSAGRGATGGASGMASTTAGRAGAGKGGGAEARGGGAGSNGTPQAGSGGAPKASGGSAGRAGGSGSGVGGGSSGAGGMTGAGKSTAAGVAQKLGRAPNFLIGMGNDLPGDYDWETAAIFSLPHALDIHYYYLTYGWQTWNEGGWFPIILAEVDAEKGVTPMVSMYGMAGWGEANLATLTTADYMGDYWDSMKLLFENYGKNFGKPAIVHLEPDFWAFAQQQTGGNPTTQEAILHPECSELPNDLTGMGRCIVKLARTYAPKVVLGFHASGWAAENGTQVGNFLKQIGGSEADIVVIDMLDRDAGCFEAGELDVCQRDGDFYWDETNRTSPNFHEHLAWAKQVSTAMGVPILWWQLPFGVPSDTPGGEPGHYRDNRVKYVFEHVQEFVDAGGVAACFGVGSEGQTFITTDGGQFANATKNYYQNPVPLP